MITVKEIIKEYLIKNNYDGLFYPGECACKIDDLCPCCAEICMNCQPGYFQNKEDVDYPEDCDFYIGPEKPTIEDIIKRNSDVGEKI